MLLNLFSFLSQKELEQSRSALAVICFGGWLGIHRFIADKIGMGIVMLLIKCNRYRTFYQYTVVIY
ncbi:NINE protein [Bartonella sp. AC53GZZY]